MHCDVEGEATAPPLTPVDGTSWLVGTPASGDWTGQEGNLACRQAGNWLYVTPRDGLRIVDRATGQERRYMAGWRIAEVPVEPSDGSVVDAEARAAILGLVAALREAGVLPDA